MDTTILDADFIYKGPMSVRVSCHAGDYGQKALCNAIGDQPLFYMDDADETDLMDDFISDATLEEMQEKLHNYDRAIKILSDIDIESTESRFASIMGDHTSQDITVEDMIAYGSQSGIFASYVEFIKHHNIVITESDDVETSFYNKDQAKIAINPYLNKLAGSCALLEAMRTAWNHKQGILINPLTFQPEETVLMNRLFAADLDITKVAYIWDLKLAGHDDVWNTMMGGSDYDLYSAYAIEAMADFRSIKNGLASRATFEKWFISDRCKNYDRNIIQVMLGNHANHEIDTSNTSRLVAMDIITRLGKRPAGNNYLTAIIPNIIHDAIYSEIRDRSNANFLWFVTFERRMAEMEQELHKDDKKADTASAIQSDESNVYDLPTARNIPNSADTNGDTKATLFVLDHFRAG